MCLSRDAMGWFEVYVIVAFPWHTHLSLFFLHVHTVYMRESSVKTARILMKEVPKARVLAKNIYSKTCVKLPSQNRQNKGLNDK